MITLEALKEIHIEASSSCSLACPMCARNFRGQGVNPQLPIVSLTLDQIRKILPANLLRNVHHIYFCGNYGDPSLCAELIPILSYLSDCKVDIKRGIYTNGVGRSTGWWSELARHVNYCQFDIDGLEDTNHIYRRGASWSTIVRNAKAFISAGGNAIWEFIVFEHNEHQISDARALSESLGFRNFVVKRTSRFIDRRTGQRLPTFAVASESGTFDGQLRPPSNDEFLVKEIVSDAESYDDYLARTEITCKAVADQSIYISSQGYVFPCCWLGNIYAWDDPESHGINQIRDRIAATEGGLESLNALRHDVPAILAGEFFATLKDGWAVGSNRLRLCSRMCGECDVTAAQFDDSARKGLHVPGAMRPRK